VVAALSVCGAVISVAGDLSPSLLDAMGPDGRLSIPLPMMVVQVVLAFAAGVAAARGCLDRLRPARRCAATRG
jgi:hypothetical protein